jgi:hypothetical protein
MTAGLLAYGCGSGGSGDPSAQNNPGDDGGIGGGGTVPEAAAGCVPKSTPDVPDDNFEDSNCDGIDGDVAAAIFVSPKGDDSAPGSITHPVKTLGKGVSLAAAAGKYVLVANATYAENVAVDAKPVSLYGGYVIDTWARSVDRATIAPSKGVPLTVTNVSAEITFDHLALKAPAGVDPGESSVGAFVGSSQNVHIRHAQIDAAAGADGAKPASPAAVTTLPTSAKSGTGYSTDNAGVCNLTSCSGNQCSYGGLPGDFGGNGGRGGDGGSIRGNPILGTSARAAAAAAVGAPADLGGRVSGQAGYSSLAGDGEAGKLGHPGVGGASAVDKVGTIGAKGYLGSNSGADGALGSDGGGGGGGAAVNAGSIACGGVGYSYAYGAGGGGGGIGGAPGAAAKGSGSGGGSFGLVSFMSTVVIEASQISTASGGRGGDSATGAVGQPGMKGGIGGTDANACTCSGTKNDKAGNGGDGGPGGTGGPGGAGGGGPSVALLSTGPAPTTKGVTINIGAGGKGGKGIAATATSSGTTDGADGLAQDKATTTAAAGGNGADAGADGGK